MTNPATEHSADKATVAPVADNPAVSDPVANPLSENVANPVAKSGSSNVADDPKKSENDEVSVYNLPQQPRSNARSRRIL